MDEKLFTTPSGPPRESMKMFLALVREYPDFCLQYDILKALGMDLHEEEVANEIRKEISRVDRAYQAYSQNAASQSHAVSLDQLRRNISLLDSFGVGNHAALFNIICLCYQSHEAIPKDFMKALARETFCSRSALHPLFQSYSDRSHATDSIQLEPHQAGTGTNSGTSFERTSLKFIVRTGDVTKVIMKLLEHVPIYSKANNGFGQKIQSVYFDDDELSLYHDRVARHEGAKLIRLRVYGGKLHKGPVFFERKLHHEKWVNIQSRKDRFKLTQERVLPFLNGTLQTCPPKVEKVDLFHEIRGDIQRLKATPSIRTEAFRSAYQFPGYDAVRFSLDEDCKMVRESVDGRSSWFTAPGDLSEEDKYRFPFAVLEVKLSGAVAATYHQHPRWSWLVDFLASNLIIESKFSKYQQGCAMYMPVRVFPLWFSDEMQVRFHDQTDPRPDYVYKCSRLQMYKPLSHISLVENQELPVRWVESQGTSKYSPSSNSHIRRPSVEVQPPTLPLTHQAPQQSNHLPLKLHTSNKLRAVSPSKSPIGASPIKSSVSFLSCCKPNSDRDVEDRQGKSPRKMNTAAQMKIEPKTFFANERTFLQWFQAAAFLSTLAVALLAELHTPYVGLMIGLVAIFMLCYSVAMYLRRFNALVSRKPSSVFGDRKGPVILVICLAASILLSVWVIEDDSARGVALLESATTAKPLWKSVDENIVDPSSWVWTMKAQPSTMEVFREVSPEKYLTQVVTHLQDLANVFSGYADSTIAPTNSQVISTHSYAQATMSNGFVNGWGVYFDHYHYGEKKERMEMSLVMKPEMSKIYKGTVASREMLCSERDDYRITKNVGIWQHHDYFKAPDFAFLDQLFPHLSRHIGTAQEERLSFSHQYEWKTCVDIILRGIPMTVSIRMKYADEEALNHNASGPWSTPTEVDVQLSIMVDDATYTNVDDKKRAYTPLELLFADVETLTNSLQANMPGDLRPPC